MPMGRCPWAHARGYMPVGPCPGADLGFFLGGGAPLRNGVTDTNKPHFFLQNTSCIRKP